MCSFQEKRFCFAIECKNVKQISHSNANKVAAALTSQCFDCESHLLIQRKKMILVSNCANNLPKQDQQFSDQAMTPLPLPEKSSGRSYKPAHSLLGPRRPPKHKFSVSTSLPPYLIMGLKCPYNFFDCGQSKCIHVC